MCIRDSSTSVARRGLMGLAASLERRLAATVLYAPDLSSGLRSATRLRHSSTVTLWDVLGSAAWSAKTYRMIAHGHSDARNRVKRFMIRQTSDKVKGDRHARFFAPETGVAQHRLAARERWSEDVGGKKQAADHFVRRGYQHGVRLLNREAHMGSRLTCDMTDAGTNRRLRVAVAPRVVSVADDRVSNGLQPDRRQQ